MPSKVTSILVKKVSLLWLAQYLITSFKQMSFGRHFQQVKVKQLSCFKYEYLYFSR